MVWAVDTDKLKQAAGSKDEKLRRMIGGRFKRAISELDELFEDNINEGEPNTYEVLRHIIDGTVPKGARGGIYFYAFKLLVEHFGRPLDNSAVSPWSSPDFSAVNAALQKMGVPFKMDDLQGVSLPVKLPLPDDFPLTGWVDEATVKKVAAAFEGAETPGPDAQTRQVVEALRGWFREAAAQGRGLVSYYH